MRVCVIGESGVAETLRGHLAAAGYEVNESQAAYTVAIDTADGANIVLAGIDGAFLNETQRLIGELTHTPIEKRRGTKHERMIQVGTNGRPEDDDAVERGLLRAILRVTGHGAQRKGIRRFWSR